MYIYIWHVCVNHNEPTFIFTTYYVLNQSRFHE
jgi:hypothetical protein